MFLRTRISLPVGLNYLSISTMFKCCEYVHVNNYCIVRSDRTIARYELEIYNAHNAYHTELIIGVYTDYMQLQQYTYLLIIICVYFLLVFRTIKFARNDLITKQYTHDIGYTIYVYITI